MSNAPVLDPRLVALKGLGFTPVHRPNGFRRIFMTYEGPPSSGKTEFIRRTRPPQVVIDFDRGMEGVAEYDIWGNEILRKTIDMPDLDQFGKTASPAERNVAIQSYTYFKELVSKTLPHAGTLIIETGGAAYSLAQVARFGQIAQVGEVPAGMWTSMQAEYEGIFLEYEKHNCNLLVSHRQGSKFKGLPGEMDLKGYKQMQYLAQVHLKFEKRFTRDVKGQVIDFEFVRVIEKCRQRVALENPSHPNHEFPVMFLDGEEKRVSVGGDFPTITQAVFPNTKPADWFPVECLDEAGEIKAEVIE